MSIKKYKKHEDISYTLGITLTIELLKYKKEAVNRVFYHSKFERSDSFFEVEKLCKKNNVNFELNDKAFNILSDKENCFVIGEFKKYHNPLDENVPHIVLVNPANAGNLGTIIRSAIGFNINNIVIIKEGVDIFDPKVIRASMGSIFHLNYEYFDSFSHYLTKYQDHQLYLFMLKGSSSLINIRFKDKFALVFGNEATGLPDEFLKYGQGVKIDHSKIIDSLNLPIAVSIALYEATKEKFLL